MAEETPYAKFLSVMPEVEPPQMVEPVEPDKVVSLTAGGWQPTRFDLSQLNAYNFHEVNAQHCGSISNKLYPPLTTEAAEILETARKSVTKDFKTWTKSYLSGEEIHTPVQRAMTFANWAWSTGSTLREKGDIWSLDEWTKSWGESKKGFEFGVVESGFIRGALGSYLSELLERGGVQLTPEEKAPIVNELSKLAGWGASFGVLRRAALMGESAMFDPLVRKGFASWLATSPNARKVLAPLGQGVKQAIASAGAGGALAALDGADQKTIMTSAAVFGLLDSAIPFGKFANATWHGETPAAEAAYNWLVQAARKGENVRETVPKLLMEKFPNNYTAAVLSSWIKRQRWVPTGEWFANKLEGVPEKFIRGWNRTEYQKSLNRGAVLELDQMASSRLRDARAVLLWKDLSAEEPTRKRVRELFLEYTGQGLTPKQFDAVLDLYNVARPAMQTAGKESVVLGLLEDKKYMDNLWTYWGRFYGRFTPGHPLHEEFMSLAEQLQKVSDQYYRPEFVNRIYADMSRFMKRKEVPLDMQREYAVITEPGFIAAKSLGDTVAANINRKLQVEVSKDPTIFLAKGTYTKAKEEMTAGSVLRRLETAEKRGFLKMRESQFLMRRVGREYGAEVYREITPSSAMRGLRTARQTDWIKARGDRWGLLEDGLLRRDVYDIMMEQFRFPGRIAKIWRKYLSFWKVSRTVWRPTTHMRNMMTNIILNDAGGLPFYRLDVYNKGYKFLRKYKNGMLLSPMEKKHLDVLIEEGLFTKTFVEGDIRGLAKQLRFNPYADPGQYEESVYNFLKDVRRAGGDVSRAMGNAYHFEEILSKTSKYFHNIEKGMEAREAAKDAIKWTLDYANVSKALDWTRTYAMPFATFTFKVIPRLVEASMTNPLRMAKWAALPWLLQSQALDELEIKKDEWERIKRMMPDYMQAGYFIPLPWRDRQGRLQMLDLTYILPWGDIGEFQQRGLKRFLQNPLLNFYSEVASNRDYAGRPLYSEFESNNVKTWKVLGHVSKSFFPTFMPGGSDFSRLQKLVTEKQTPTSLTPTQAMSATFTPFKVVPRSEGQIRASYTGRVRLQSSEAKHNLRNDLERLKGVEDREKRIRRFREELKRIRNQP